MTISGEVTSRGQGLRLRVIYLALVCMLYQYEDAQRARTLRVARGSVHATSGTRPSQLGPVTVLIVVIVIT
ncbi:hypothetical protein HW555_003796 [Spodoptera exigua]|uniref:Uncharacterized protein n=1 Tax=Spodoptera exigua TaxID=7107 RepID=A0A835L862_SPOEX|nr:hypothetical protein HW555_003796 [Spodoptera exigua]